MKQAKAYLANQFGFSETGRYILDTLIIPRIEKIGITVNNPFEKSSKELDLEQLEKMEKYDDRVKYWRNFSKKISSINNKLMKDSDCMLALLDGGHAVDDGTASEIGYYAGIKRGPIFALRSDIRYAENMATTVNAQILGYIVQSNGQLIDGPNAIERWFDEIQKWYDSLRE